VWVYIFVTKNPFNVGSFWNSSQSDKTLNTQFHPWIYIKLPQSELLLLFNFSKAFFFFFLFSKFLIIFINIIYMVMLYIWDIDSGLNKYIYFR
jgi:hypothetical protein